MPSMTIYIAKRRTPLVNRSTLAKASSKAGFLQDFLGVSFVKIICVWFLLGMTPAIAATGFPQSVPLRFGIDKSVELAAALTRYRNYYLDIVFHFKDEQQRTALKKIVGEPTPICKALNDCGVTPSFLVTIKAGMDVILREESKPIGYYAHGSSRFYRNILITPLKPGTYTITVEVTQSENEMANTTSTIDFSTDSREADLRN
jgi:hypothetical protein